MNRFSEEFVKFKSNFKKYLGNAGFTGLFFTYISILFLFFVVLHKVYVVYTVPIGVTFLVLNLVSRNYEDSFFKSFFVFLTVFMVVVSPMIISYIGNITVEEIYSRALFSNLSFWGYALTLVLCFVLYPAVRIYIGGEGLRTSFFEGLRYVFYSPWVSMFRFVFSTGVVVLPVMLVFLFFRLFPSMNPFVLGLPLSLYVGSIFLTISGMAAEIHLTEEFDGE